jgi:hypothetical protein
MKFEVGQPVEIRTDAPDHWAKGIVVSDRGTKIDVHIKINGKRYFAVFSREDVRPRLDDHPDSKAVDVFARAMKEKLYQARLKGRGGWDKPEECTTDLLAKMLMQHTTKGDPVDIANFAMMLFMRKAKGMVLELAAREFQEAQAAPLREELEDIKELCIEAGCTDPEGEYIVPAITFVEELRQRTVCKASSHPLDGVPRESIEEFLALCEDFDIVRNLCTRETKQVWDALAGHVVDEDQEDPL